MSQLEKTSEKILKEYNPNNSAYIHEDDAIGAMETYANLRTASLIQTIENRIAEIQQEIKDAVWPISISELKGELKAYNNLLTLIKS